MSLDSSNTHLEQDKRTRWSDNPRKCNSSMKVRENFVVLVVQVKIEKEKALKKGVDGRKFFLRQERKGKSGVGEKIKEGVKTKRNDRRGA